MGKDKKSGAQGAANFVPEVPILMPSMVCYTH